MMKRTFLYLILIALVASCAPPWSRVDQHSNRLTSAGYSANLPVGWMSFGNDKENVVLSRDGIGIQFISLESTVHEKAFEEINEISNNSMLPSELAELAVALIKTQHEMTSVEVIENKPAVVGGYDGFRLHVSFENENGLNYEGVVYGVSDPKRVYLLSFYATQLHYFSRDIPEFEKLVRSFILS